jgi:thiol-disulfide isomerase/thioredoxin
MSWHRGAPLWHGCRVEITTLTGAGVAAGVLLASTGAGLWWRRRTGVVRPVSRPSEPHADLLAGLGVAAGTPVTLLQFSSAFCAPCRATRRVCAQIAEAFEGVRHIEIDAESHLDAVRALGIWRTPTVLVVDAAHTVVQRATGQPSRAQVIAAIAPLLPGRPPDAKPQAGRAHPAEVDS